MLKTYKTKLQGPTYNGAICMKTKIIVNYFRVFINQCILLVFEKLMAN